MAETLFFADRPEDAAPSAERWKQAAAQLCAAVTVWEQLTDAEREQFSRTLAENAAHERAATYLLMTGLRGVSSDMDRVLRRTVTGLVNSKR